VNPKAVVYVAAKGKIPTHKGKRNPGHPTSSQSPSYKFITDIIKKIGCDVIWIEVAHVWALQKHE
jgi:hypothetical protein